jgi:hypothetical protein
MNSASAMAATVTRSRRNRSLVSLGKKLTNQASYLAAAALFLLAEAHRCLDGLSETGKEGRGKEMEHSGQRQPNGSCGTCYLMYRLALLVLVTVMSVSGVWEFSRGAGGRNRRKCGFGAWLPHLPGTNLLPPPP